MNDYTFGNFVYTLRTGKNMSQSELGSMLGVTNKAVSKWENNNKTEEEQEHKST